jgi:hypothetical protein
VSDVPFVTLAQGDSYTARLENPTLLLAGTPAEVARINGWLAGSDASASLEGVDLATTVVVALFRGQVGSSGYGVTIERLTRDSAGVRLVARLTAPGAGQMVADVIAYPYHLIAVPRDQIPDALGTRWTAVTPDGVLLVEAAYP